MLELKTDRARLVAGRLFGITKTGVWLPFLLHEVEIENLLGDEAATV